METPSMQREGKSATKLGFAQAIRAVLKFFLPVTVFIIILSYPYWPPCPPVMNLSHPLFNSLPPLLDRKFMFLLCNVILIFLSGAFLTPGDQRLPWKKMLDVFDEYIIKKRWFSMTQERNIMDRPKSPAIEKGFQRTSADVKEKKKEDSGREREAGVAAGGGEGQSVLDGLEREEEEEQFIEEDRKFDEFIARGYENWKREHQLLNSKA